MFDVPILKQSPGYSGNVAGVTGVGMDEFAKYQALLNLLVSSGQAAGRAMLCSWPYNPEQLTTDVALTNQRLTLIPQLVKGGVPIDGVAWIQSVPGVYTANNNNKIGAYTFDGTTFTRVAQCADTPALWKGANGFQSQPFTTQYIPASDMLLWAAQIYCSSAVTTGPTVSGVSNVSATAVRNLGLLGGFCFQSDNSGSTDLGASFLRTAVVSSNNIHPWFAFYHQY